MGKRVRGLGAERPAFQTLEMGLGLFCPEEVPTPHLPCDAPGSEAGRCLRSNLRPATFGSFLEPRGQRFWFPVLNHWQRTQSGLPNLMESRLFKFDLQKHLYSK